MIKHKNKHLFKDGFIQGMGWAFGVTVGFVIVSTLLALLLKVLGGTPYIGKRIANIVEATQIQLEKRNPISPK